MGVFAAWRILHLVTLLCMSDVECSPCTTPPRPQRADGGSSSMDLSPLVAALPPVVHQVPPRSARAGSGGKTCMCKLYATDADGESVRTCAGFPLQHKQRSVSLWSRASYDEITRIRYNKLKLRLVYQDEAELIAGKLTNGLKDKGNFKLCMYHFPSAQTTHSGRCRIIIDCTEIEIQRPEDDEIAKQH
ncbi:hypothetical protein T492DRAFT_302674 [Pavlovales sp. CCMP2436]|nr:hypothetical protein T492DRAFT_302674 [Pavlovales sp. CCMP2436]